MMSIMDEMPISAFKPLCSSSVNAQDFTNIIIIVDIAIKS